MSFHQSRPSNPSTSPSPDLQGARTLASFLAQRGAPGYRESPSSHEIASKTPRTSHGYDQRNAIQQGPNYPTNYSREFGSGPDPSRHPSLSLDTRNLVPPSGRTPSPTSAPPPLQSDLSTLKAGLESLWTRSSRSLHSLHHTLAAERDAHMRTARDREMLAAANANIWADKVRLEGERRELRAKLDAQAAAADARERASGSGSGNVRVKMEEDTDDDENISIPMREVQRIIEERLQNQADEFARETTELYSKLAAAQRRATDLEAHLTRTRPLPSPAPASAPSRAPPNPLSPVTPHTGQPSSHSDREFPFVRRRPGSGSGPGDMGASDARMHSNGVGAPHIVGPSYPAPGGSHSGTPLEDSRAYAALRPPPRAHGGSRDAYPHRRSHPHPHPQQPHSHPQHENALQRTLSLPTVSPPMEGLARRTVSGSAATAAPSQRVPPPAPPYPQRQIPPQSFGHHPLSQQQPYPGPHSQYPGQQGSGSHGPPPASHAPPPSSHVPPPTSHAAPPPSHPPTSSSHPPTHPPPPIHPPTHPPPPSHPPPPPSHPPPPPSYPPPPSSHPPPPVSQSKHPLPQPPHHPYPPPQQNHNVPGHPPPPIPPPSGPSRTSSYTAPPPAPPSRPPPTAAPPPVPTPPRHASSSPIMPTQLKLPIEHSRPNTPTPPPPKRMRTEDPNSVQLKPHVQDREMTEEEKRTLGALNSVLTRKRDGAGWKCVLCRQEKKSPTATFSEATPISVVTQHVRGVHLTFWETLGDT